MPRFYLVHDGASRSIPMNFLRYILETRLRDANGCSVAPTVLLPQRQHPRDDEVLAWLRLQS
jgi:hypothetical protein